MPTNNEFQEYYKELRKSLRQWRKYKEDWEDFLQSTVTEDEEGGPGSNPPSPPPPPPPTPPGGQG